MSNVRCRDVHIQRSEIGYGREGYCANGSLDGLRSHQPPGERGGRNVGFSLTRALALALALARIRARV